MMMGVSVDMILTCANCQTRYLVPDSALGLDGRRVRCTKCQNEWFQEPEFTDAGAGDDSAPAVPDDLEPIPEGVRPIPEGSALPALVGEGADQIPPAANRGGLWAGVAVTAVIFLAAVAGLYVMRDTAVKIWPPSYALYDLAGIAPTVPGEGLIFDRLSAVAAVNEDGIRVLEVQGFIVNLRGSESLLPPVQTALRQGDGTVFDTWKIDPPQPIVPPHGEIEFKTSYSALPDDVKEAALKFMLVN